MTILKQVKVKYTLITLIVAIVFAIFEMCGFKIAHDIGYTDGYEKGYVNALDTVQDILNVQAASDSLHHTILQVIDDKDSSVYIISHDLCGEIKKGNYILIYTK
jgi:hypothetical protein